MEDNKNTKAPGTDKTATMPKQDLNSGETDKIHVPEGDDGKREKVAKMETAERRIVKPLVKSDVEHTAAEVHEALIPLYERYELNGTVPTQESFAEACRNQNAGQHVADMPKNPFRYTGKRNALIGIGCAAVAAIVIAGAAIAIGNSSNQQPASEPEQESVATVQTTENQKVSVKVNCDGWNADTSTPIVVSMYQGDVKDTLTSTDENTTVPDPLLTKEVPAGESTELDELTDAGTYTIAITGSPVLEDGTIFDLPEPQVIDFDTATGQEVDFTLTPKAAEQVTEADIAAAQATAAAAGADTTKVTNNANKANEKAASAQGGQVKQGTANAVTKSNANKSGNSNNQGNQGGNSGGNQGGNSQGGNSGGNQGGNQGGNSQGGSSQPHQHNWVAQTKTVHHDAVYENQTTYVHHDAIYETKTVSVCATCGAENPSSQHSKNHAMNGQSDQVVEKQKRIKVKGAYDEPVAKRVLVKAAYDETVTTGYRCSTCGTTK